MKKYLVIFACLQVGVAMAFDGHNDIKFTSTQKEIENKGFVCRPPEKPKPKILAECRHMDMVGVMFGYKSTNYRIQIGKDRKVDMIGADLVGRLDSSDYFALQEKISFNFPKKNEEGSFVAQGVAIRDEWHAQNGASAILLLTFGVAPVTKTNLSITFWSPRYSKESAKN